ncbi:bis(5'-nucleosyl)-tetraphosphatase (symmetrical) YqeK [Sporolactobacillus shoreicorticis]|uniref:bis(5'-nucleosyl)-tetraphosphatase (symmetrical) n=2 Tax=Sporolactobacillus shoreicorticis TaxID=1923877 RepID=A0ABW5S2T2_9BACL
MNLFSEFIQNVHFTGDPIFDSYHFLRNNQLPLVADHSRRVSEEANRLARVFGTGEKKAEIAGALHDISAVIPNNQRLSVARELTIDVLEEEAAFPMILHQKISKVMARDLFHVTDLEILNAIECHTTLRSHPSVLDLIVFVADKIEWDQQGIPPYLDELKQQLQSSLEAGAYAYIHYLWKRKDKLKVVHPWLAEAYFENVRR